MVLSRLPGYAGSFLLMKTAHNEADYHMFNRKENQRTTGPVLLTWVLRI